MKCIKGRMQYDVFLIDRLSDKSMVLIFYSNYCVEVPDLLGVTENLRKTRPYSL